MIHEGYLPYQLRVSDSYPLGSIWQSQQDVYRIISQQKAHLKMDKTRHAICHMQSMIHRHWPTDFSCLKELEQHDTHKDHRENEVRTCWRVRLPKKDLYLAGCVFFTKKRLAPLLRDFRIDIFSQPTKNGQVQCWLLLKGEFWWSSWKVIGVIMMWILGFSSEFDYLSPSSKFLIDFMFQNKITSGGAFQGNTKTKRLISVLLHCGRSGGATINSQCLFRPRNSNLHWPYALRRAPGTPSKCL